VSHFVLLVMGCVAGQNQAKQKTDLRGVLRT
jgi:hypothetical protein